MPLSQITAEFVPHETTDLSVTNIARTSFDNWNTRFNPDKDIGLINYLSSHKHISPFFHQRFTFCVDELAESLLLEDPTLRMGLEYDYVTSLVQHSFFGWVRMLEEKVVINEYIADTIRVALHAAMPISCAAYKVPLPSGTEEAEEFGDAGLDKFKTISMRLTMPIFCARQLFTHRAFATNEISRRYVDSDPEFYQVDEWRLRPEGGIKQGSSNLTVSEEVLHCPSQESCIEASAAYYFLMESNVAPEQARMILPQSMMTQVIFTGSLTAWKAMLVLRSSEHTQYETRYLAEQIQAVLDTI